MSVIDKASLEFHSPLSCWCTFFDNLCAEEHSALSDGISVLRPVEVQAHHCNVEVKQWRWVNDVVHADSVQVKMLNRDQKKDWTTHSAF